MKAGINSERFVFKVKVIPKARGDLVDGLRGDSLLVRVKAVPERGKANEAVREVLSAALDLPVSSIAIEGGSTSRLKTVSVPESARRAVESLLLKSRGS